MLEINWQGAIFWGTTEKLFLYKKVSQFAVLIIVLKNFNFICFVRRNLISSARLKVF